MLSWIFSQRGAHVAVALAVLSLCNSTNYGNNSSNSVDARQMLDGAEEIGLIGSMRHQTNVLPVARNQFVRDQLVANENDPAVAMMNHFQVAKMKREAPSAPGATAPASYKADQKQQDQTQQQVSAAQPAQTNQTSGAGAQPSTFTDKLQQQLNMASQQVQKYSDQLAAQIPKRLKRQAQYSSSPGKPGEQFSQSFGQQQQHGHDDGNGDSSPKLSQLGDKLHSVRQMVESLRARCAEGHMGPAPGNQREQRLRRQSPDSLSGQERSSSGGPSKLVEIGEKLKNRTNEARQLVQSIRQQCAERLGERGQQAAPRLRRQAQSPAGAAVPSGGASSGQQPPTSLFDGGASAQLATFTDQVRNRTGAAIQQLQTMRDQFVASVGQTLERQTPKRAKRQIQYPSLDQQNTPTGTNGGSGTAGSSGSSIMKYLADLGQQAQQAQAISQLFSAAGASGAQGPGASSPQASAAGGSQQSTSSGLNTVAQMMGQLTDLIKSTQDRNARALESSQRSLETTNQQTVDAAKSAQGGIQAALNEMGQGLQKLAANNPNLVPDIKNLYQTVATRLSSASSSVAQTAGQQQPQTPPSLPVAQS